MDSIPCYDMGNVMFLCDGMYAHGEGFRPLGFRPLGFKKLMTEDSESASSDQVEPVIEIVKNNTLNDE